MVETAVSLFETMAAGWFIFRPLFAAIQVLLVSMMKQLRYTC
jgi:hypothetical protein